MSRSRSVVTSEPSVPQTRSFNWFLASAFASAVGRNGYHIACAWILIVAGQGSGAVAGFFAIISLTELVTSPLAGWLADRFDRRTLCVIAETARAAAATALGAVLMGTNVLWALWLSAALFATCDRIALTASQSMIPSINGGFSLAAANSMNFFLMQSGSLAAAGIVGVLLQTSNPTFTFGAVAVTFVFSAIFMRVVRSENVDSEGSLDAKGDSLVVDCHFVRLGAVYALLYTGGMLISAIGPSFVFDEHGGNAINFGQLESSWSAGSILGAVLLVPLAWFGKSAVLQFVILGASALSFALLKALELPYALAAFAMLGALYNLGRVALEVRIQSTVSVAALGRAKGVFHSVGVLLGVVLFAVVSMVGDALQPSTVFLAYGVILAIGTVVLFLFRAKAPKMSVEQCPG